MHDLESVGLRFSAGFGIFISCRINNNRISKYRSPSCHAMMMLSTIKGRFIYT